jgi:nucleoid-associated protein EbfC
MLDKMKQLYELQKKAKEMEKALESVVVTRESPGGRLKLSMNGQFRVTSLSIDESALAPGNRAVLEKGLTELFNGAADEARQQSSRQAMGMMKGMNIPGF